jgi:hypothetical protein
VGPTIRSASLVDYPEIAGSVGLDPYKILKGVGLPRSCLRNPDLRISADAVADLLEASASAARVEDFALRLAQRRGLSNWDRWLQSFESSQPCARQSRWLFSTEFQLSAAPPSSQDAVVATSGCGSIRHTRRTMNIFRATVRVKSERLPD